MFPFSIISEIYYAPRCLFRVDAVAVKELAKLMGHLHFMTSQEQSTKQGYLVNKITANSNSGTRDPLLFGHVGEQHFISLGNNDGVV